MEQNIQKKDKTFCLSMQSDRSASIRWQRHQNAQIGNEARKKKIYSVVIDMAALNITFYFQTY